MSKSEWDPTILAAITTEEGVFEGNIPIVLAKDEEEKEALAVDLARIMRADVFQLSNGSYVLLPIHR